MTLSYRVGQRASFQNALCTVRYIGLVDGTEKEWLGVEWDDPLRGKHDGEHKGKRYFKCLSNSKIAASFVRPTRPADPPQSFVEAVHQKYATEINTQTGTIYEDKLHVISGKVVEEVGFDKIRRQLAQLRDLKIVIVDGMRVNSTETESLKIRDVCPKIVELDLSRNLFENFQEVIDICGELDSLRNLRINGNRFSQVQVKDKAKADERLNGITHLELDDVLLSWDEICILTENLKVLKNFTASSNFLTSITTTPTAPFLRSLTLEYNGFTAISDLAPLAAMKSLEVLLLKGNRISQVSSQPDHPTFGKQLHYVDLSYNAVTVWSFVDALPAVFPGMTALRFAHNPVYENAAMSQPSESSSKSFEEGYMLTLARLGQLKTLNFSNISTADRTNAEMYYLSLIGRALAEVPESQEQMVLFQHKRYQELVELYGEPSIIRKSKDALNPNILEARLIRFKFYIPTPGEKIIDGAHEKEIEIPKSFDVYRVKGIVGKTFGVKPLGISLIWETGEWDPVAGYEDEGNDSENDDDQPVTQKNAVSSAVADASTKQKENGKWMKREVEIEDGTRQIGFWIDGMEAIVRVVIR